jgi:hypothetical protein
MASATSPGKHLISKEREGRSPLGVGALSLARARIPQTEEENAHGETYRAGRACVKLHAGGGGPEREAAGLGRGGDERTSANRGAARRPAEPTRASEEGTLSEWLHEVLEPHVEELVVAGVRKSRGPKSDKRDALALAEQLRIGALETRVYKGRGKFRRLDHVARGYGLMVVDVARVKNRVKNVLARGPEGESREGAAEGGRRAPRVAAAEDVPGPGSATPAGFGAHTAGPSSGHTGFCLARAADPPWAARGADRATESASVARTGRRVHRDNLRGSVGDRARRPGHRGGYPSPKPST